MKAVIGGLAAVAIGAGAYFMLAGPSSEDMVVDLLRDAFGEAADVALDGCDLQISARGGTELGTVFTVLRVDLRMYDVQTVQIVPNRDRFAYLAGRETATNAMLAQARAVFDAIGAGTADMLPDDDGMRAVLNDPTGSLSSRLIAIVETDADGNSQLAPHEDGPKVHGFIAAVHQLPAPVSYQTTAFYVGEPATAEGLRTGEIIALPRINLSFETKASAKAFGQAMYDHAAFVCP